MCFRKFPHMKSLWHPNSQKQLDDLEPKHRDLVKKWEKQPGALPQICRNFDVHAALQSLGVYEVGFGNTAETGKYPSADQVTAYLHFREYEQTICERACDALVRYYIFLRGQQPDLFVDETDCPETAESVDDLAACVRFDGMNFTAESVEGSATISFGWDVDWDMQHGLQMIFHQDQVIAIGNDLYGPADVEAMSTVMQQILNNEERKALDHFRASTRD